MSDFKGFGSETKGPTPRLIKMRDSSKGEMDRVFTLYLQQGIGKERAQNLLATSLMFFTASEEGMIEGEDYRWDSEDGIFMSGRMTEWVKSFVPDQAWQHMKMEGFVRDPLDEPVLTASGGAKFLLFTAKDPRDTNDGGAAARLHCAEAMEAAGFSRFDAESKVRRYLNGDESLEQELLDGIAAGLPILFKREQG